MSSTAVEDDSDEEVPYVMMKPRHASMSAVALKTMPRPSAPSAPSAPKPLHKPIAAPTPPIALCANPGEKPNAKEVLKAPPKSRAVVTKVKSSLDSESDNESDSSSDHDSDVETDEDEPTSSEDDDESEDGTRPAKRAKPLDTAPLCKSRQLRDSISRALQPTSFAIGLSGIAAKLKTLETTLLSESKEELLEAFTDLLPSLIDALCSKPTLEQAQLRHVARSLQGVWHETLPKLEVLASIAKEQQQSSANTAVALSELLGAHLGVAGTLAATFEQL